ncbi:hypothetical protein [Spartinivicinus poritis]|uniref:Uncharacterized protein n=1 Tax=Spartinivicinus poritis TaxID=2994640 RepID=A0ABT5U8L5_9GAMM|nr:hypothetical protein [Spartinivicinus sp. A2-2]MDE1462716.1 hypothetical protein [Spartinivicinus sp. A2-2]
MKPHSLVLTTILTAIPALSFSDPILASDQTVDEFLKQQGLDGKTRAALTEIFKQHQLTFQQDEFGNPTIISQANKQGSYAMKIERRQSGSEIINHLDQGYNDRLATLEQEIKQLKQMLKDMSQQLNQLKSQ